MRYNHRKSDFIVVISFGFCMLNVFEMKWALIINGM